MTEELFKKSDVTKLLAEYIGEDYALEFVGLIPIAELKRGEWIDRAISIIDDMQREGIVDYQQAWEYRMRARMKGADDE